KPCELLSDGSVEGPAFHVAHEARVVYREASIDALSPGAVAGRAAVPPARPEKGPRFGRPARLLRTDADLLRDRRGQAYRRHLRRGRFQGHGSVRGARGHLRAPVPDPDPAHCHVAALMPF